MTKKPRIDRFGHVHPPRRSIPLSLLIAVVVLLAISLGARQWLQQFVASIEAYEPPALPEIAPGDGTTAIAQRGVILIVDGLREDAARELPALEDLRRLGAQAEVQVPSPATTRAAWVTILSGSRPELNGAPLLEPVPNEADFISVDHLLRRAQVTRHSTALVGHQAWESLIPGGMLNDTTLSPGKTTEDDNRLVQEAVTILTTNQPDLMVIQISQLDEAGLTYGATSDEYSRAALRVNDLVRRIALTVDLESTLLVVTSSHGHLDNGGYGGPEPAVATVPFVIAGPGVKPGQYSAIDQIDVAPTVAALLGLPIPAESQGTIRFEMLDLSAPLRTEKALSLAEQQTRFSDAYLRAIGQGGASGRPAQTLTVARSAWDINNYAGAFEIAQQSDADARQEMLDGRAARIEAERSERRMPVLAASAALLLGLLALLSLRTAWLLGAGLLAWLGPLGNAQAPRIVFDQPDLRWLPAIAGAALGLGAAVWAWRRRRWEHVVVAGAAIGVGLLYALRPEAFSPSIIGREAAFRSSLIWHTVVAMAIGAGAVVSLVWHTEDDLRAIARTSYGYVFLLSAGLIVQLAAGYWLLGPQITWYLPDANLVFWHVSALVQTMLVAALGIFLPAIVVPAVLILRRLRRPASVGSPVQAAGVERIRP